MELDLPIITPEKALLTYRLAGLAKRVRAHLTDLLIIVGVLAALIVGPGTGMARVAVAPIQGIFLAVIMILISLGPFAYFIFFEWAWNGQTPGKRSQGIRVRMVDGTPVTFLAALTRNLLRPADFLPVGYFVGFIAIAINPSSQRVGDFAANTVVTIDVRPERLTVTAPHRVGFHRYESEIGNLPGMTRMEYESLRKFCDRIYELSPETQAKLYRDLWQPFAKRRFIPNLEGVEPLLLAEAAVMKYGRQHGLL